jgi:hypothetical protein
LTDHARLAQLLTVNTKALRREGEIHTAAATAGGMAGSDHFHLSTLGTQLHRIADAIDAAARSDASLSAEALKALDTTREARDRDDAKDVAGKARESTGPATEAEPPASVKAPSAAGKAAKASAPAQGGRKRSAPTHEDVGSKAERPDVKA